MKIGAIKICSFLSFGFAPWSLRSASIIICGILLLAGLCQGQISTINDVSGLQVWLHADSTDFTNGQGVGDNGARLWENIATAATCGDLGGLGCTTGGPPIWDEDGPGDGLAAVYFDGSGCFVENGSTSCDDFLHTQSNSIMIQFYIELADPEVIYYFMANDNLIVGNAFGINYQDNSTNENMLRHRIRKAVGQDVLTNTSQFDVAPPQTWVLAFFVFDNGAAGDDGIGYSEVDGDATFDSTWSAERGTTVASPAGVGALTIGTDADFANDFQGWVRQIALFDEALPQSTIEDIIAWVNNSGSGESTVLISQRRGGLLKVHQ